MATSRNSSNGHTSYTTNLQDGNSVTLQTTGKVATPVKGTQTGRLNPMALPANPKGYLFVGAQRTIVSKEAYQ